MAEETARLEAVVSADTRLYESAMRAILASAQQATSRASAEFNKLDRAQQQAALGAERLTQAHTRTRQETTRLAQEQANLARATAQAARAQLQLQNAQERSVQSALGFGQAYRQIQGTLAALGLGRVIQETVQLSNRARALELAFQTVTGSAERGRETLTFLRQESDRLGVVFLDTARAFQGIAAAAQGTVLEGEAAREIFLGITEAARATGRTQDELSRALVGVQQIIGKGVVSMEELRQQLGEALPQSIQTFARALGVTTPRLFELIEAGKVGLPELLRFGRQLRTDVADNIDAASQTFEASTNRFITATQDLGVSTGNLITQSQGANESLNLLSETIALLATGVRAPTTAFEEFVAGILLGANAVVLLRKNTEEQIGVLGRLKEAYQDVQQFLGLRPPDLPAASVSGTPLAGAPVPDTDELIVRRGSRAAEDEATAIARITELRAQHAKAVIGSAKEQAAAIQKQLADEEQAIKRNTIAYAEINRLRTEGPPSVRQAQELRAQLRVLEEIIPRLSQADQALARLDVQRLQGQLQNLAESSLPDSVRQARDLEREITRVRNGLQGLSPDERALGLKELQALETQLLQLGTAALPPTVQQVRELESEIRRLEEAMTSLPADERFLAEFDLQEARDQLQEFSQRGLPDAVIQTQNLRVEIERLQDVINNRALELGPIGIEQAQQTLSQLQQQLNELAGVGFLNATIEATRLRVEIERIRDLITNQSLELGPLGTEAAVQSLQALEDRLRGFGQIGLPDTVIQVQNLRVEAERLRDTIENRALELGPIGVDLAKQALVEVEEQYIRLEQVGGAAGERLIQQAFELEKALARTPAEATEAFRRYIQALEDANVSHRRIQEIINDRTIESIREQQQLRRQQAEDIRESTRDLVSLVETVFDAFDLGSKKTEARIKLFLQAFSTAIQQIAQQAEQANITPGVTGRPPSGNREILAGEGAGQAVQQVSSAFGFQSPGGSNQFGALGTAYGQFQGGNTTGAISTALAGLGAGLSLYQTTLPLFQALAQYDPGTILAREFFGERAGQRVANISGGIAAGATGGFVTGGIYGAIIGAVVGGVLGGLQDIPRSSSIQVETAKIPKAVDDALGLYIEDTLAIVHRDRRASGSQERLFQDGITAVVKSFLDQFQAVIDAAPKDVQQAAGGAINEILQELGTFVEGIGVTAMENFGGTIRELVESLGPALQAEFQPLLDTIGRIADITTAVDNAINALEQRRDAILGGLREQRQRLEETFQSPGRVFVSRQQELERLVQQFQESSGAEQVALVPQIQALIDEVFSLANREDVLGGDMTALLELQANLLDINKQVEEASGRAFESQIDLAQQQRDALVDMVSSLASLRNVTEEQFREANRTLNRIAEFLATQAPGRFVGSFQTAQGESRTVPATGFAVVHQGETVSRGVVGNTTNNFSITVNAPANTNVQALSRDLLDQIELQMNRRERFRQTPTSRRN